MLKESSTFDPTPEDATSKFFLKYSRRLIVQASKIEKNNQVWKNHADHHGSRVLINQYYSFQPAKLHV